METRLKWKKSTQKSALFDLSKAVKAMALATANTLASLDPYFYYQTTPDEGVTQHEVIELAKKLKIFQKVKEKEAQPINALGAGPGTDTFTVTGVSVTPDTVLSNVGLGISRGRESADGQLHSNRRIPFTSVWSEAEQPLKYSFDKAHFDSQNLLSAVGACLYTFHWSMETGKSRFQLHQKVYDLLDGDLDSLSSGCTAVYYRWMSSKQQEKVIQKRDRARSTDVDSSSNTGTQTGGHGRSSITGPQPQGRQTGFRARTGSNAASESQRSSSTVPGKPGKGGAREITPTPTTSRAGPSSRSSKSHHAAERSAQNSIQFSWKTVCEKLMQQQQQSNANAGLYMSSRDGLVLKQQQSALPDDMENPKTPPKQVGRSKKTRPLTTEDGIEAASLLKDFDDGQNSNLIVQRNVITLRRVVELLEYMRRQRDAEDRRLVQSGKFAHSCRIICYANNTPIMPGALPEVASIPPEVVPKHATTAKLLPKELTSLDLKEQKAMKKERAKTAPMARRLEIPSAISHEIRVAPSFRLTDAINWRCPEIPASGLGQQYIFIAGLPDASYSAYYPGTGKPAVIQNCIRNAPADISATITLAFNQTATGELIVAATPTSIYAFSPNRNQRLFADRNHGVSIVSAEISVALQLRWPSLGSALKSPIAFELNDYLTLYLSAADDIQLAFDHDGAPESFRFNLAFNTSNHVIPPPEEKLLRSKSAFECMLTSKAASELMKATSKVSKTHSHRIGGATTISSVGTPSIVSVPISAPPTAKKLMFFDAATLNEMDVQMKRIRHRISCIVDLWRNHYNLWLGMLDKLEDAEVLSTNPRALLSLIMPLNHRPATPFRTSSFSQRQQAIEELDARIATAPSRLGRRAVTVISSTPGVLASNRSGSMSPDRSATPNTDRDFVLENKSRRESSQLLTVQSALRIDLSPTRPISPRPATTAGVTSSRPDSSMAAGIMLTAPISPKDHLQLVGLCPEALRRNMTLGGLESALAACCPGQQTSPKLVGLAFCQCRRLKSPPLLSDIEIDVFIKKYAPPHQVIVVHITDVANKKVVEAEQINSSIFEEPGSRSVGVVPTMEDILDQLYTNMSYSRSRPCIESVYDRFRLFRYDVTAAKSMAAGLANSSIPVPRRGLQRRGLVPLLVARHGVRPGQTLCYYAGNLISCSSIEPATTQAVLQSIDASWRLALRDVRLPDDFRCRKPSPPPPLLSRSVTPSLRSARKLSPERPKTSFGKDLDEFDDDTEFPYLKVSIS